MDVEESETFSRTVVVRLKEVRQRKGWSQAKLAEKAGVSRTGVTMVESGERRPTLMFCHALTTALEVSLSEIIADLEADR